MDGYDKSGMEPRWASDEFILEPTEGNSFAKYLSESPWGTDITNSLLNAYLKVGKPLREDGSSSIAAIADWSWQKSDSWFGASSYLASQHSGFINLLYRNMLMSRTTSLSAFPARSTTLTRLSQIGLRPVEW